jgi:hypothetical protein
MLATTRTTAPLKLGGDRIRRMTVEERVNPLIEEAVGLPNDRKAILAVSCFTTNLGNPDDSSDDAVYDSI